jgi:signal transduction histidine kinase
MPLRLQILIITLLTPATFVLATLWLVHADVSHHVNTSSIHESLERSSAVFESQLSARYEALAVAARVIVQDPRFFSLLSLRGSQRDARFRKTVRGMARDFEKITKSDIFEVLDRRGQVLASVGHAATIPSARNPFVGKALRGLPVSGILVEGPRHFQVVVMPVVTDRQVAGVLLLGGAIGDELAAELKAQTRSEVTFVSARTITGSTLAAAADRDALVHDLDRLGLTCGGDFSRTGITEVKGGALTYFTVVRPLPGAGEGVRQLYVMQRSADPEISFLRQMQTHLGELGLIGILVALATGFVFSRRITSPLQRLVRAAQEMERGNYEYPVEVRRGDEVGYLAERFRTMRQHEQTYVHGLEESARLKTTFISVVSHELRTPISVIRGYYDILAGGGLGPLAPPQRQALDRIADSTTRLLKVAEDATLIAQIQSQRLALNRTEHDLANLLEVAIGMATAQAQAAGRIVKVERRCDPALHTAFVDVPRLSHAICNLICNGIRFSPDGACVEVIGRPADGGLVIEVRDSGVGIAPEKLAKLLEKSSILTEIENYQSSTSLDYGSSGMGLGFAIARGVVEAHGGTISVESQEGVGSSFTIRLPSVRPEDLEQAA